MKISYTFWPVGQGLFSSGELKLSEKNRFRWIYDCGTVSAQHRLDSSIKELAEEWDTNKPTKPQIDVLIISHFDRDHISGLDRLLTRFLIKTILLPYMPLWQRLFHALVAGVTDKDALINFFINPAKYISDIPGAEGAELIFILPNSDQVPVQPPPQDSDEFLQASRRDARTDEERALTLGENSNKLVVKFLTSQRLVVNKLWEFVPYNDAQVLENRRPKPLLIFQKMVAGLTDESIKQKPKEVVSQLRKLYDAQFGKSSQRRNLISLFLYAGPVANPKSFEICGCATVGEKRCECFLWRSENDLRASILYTGDGFLDTAARLNAAKAYFGTSRIDKLLCFQVMHHGAEGNWQRGLANKFKPRYSVFSSDPRRINTKHPHSLVKADFRPFGPIQVNIFRFTLDFFALGFEA